jgi:hypothetical protein
VGEHLAGDLQDQLLAQRAWHPAGPGATGGTHALVDSGLLTRQIV